MILFENDGTLDMRAVKTMGVSAKDEGRSVFGYFGTGLKYAIAVLLRNGHKVWIHDGLGNQYEFGIQGTKIREQYFDIVTMNGEELGFTTALGKNWETWMAFRELHCNATDEGGFSKAVNNGTWDAREELGKVRVMVIGAEIETVFGNKDEYILNPRRAWTFNEMGVEMYKKVLQSNPRGSIFYKGVRVGITPEPSVYDYNFLNNLDLTEDRTLKYAHHIHQHLGDALLASPNATFITELMMAPQMTFEERLSLSYSYGKPSDIFLDTIGALRTKFKDLGINQYAIDLHMKHRKKSMMPTESCPMTNIQIQQLTRAREFCHEQLGIDTQEFPLIICEDLGGRGSLGLADMDSNIMYLSLACFSKGTKYVVIGLIEEHTHLKHRVADETFEQKQVYLEMIASLGEQLQGKPL